MGGWVEEEEMKVSCTHSCIYNPCIIQVVRTRKARNEVLSILKFTRTGGLDPPLPSPPPPPLK